MRKDIFFGRTWTTIERLAGEIARKERTPRQHMPSLVEKLKLLESTVGEEYYILVQLKTLQYMTREMREIYNVDLEDLRDILETIIRDEEIHRKLVKNEKNLVGEEQQTEDKPPAVKYKNPDAWSRTMPESIYEDAH